MATQARLTLLYDDSLSGGDVNIFIHGYKAITSAAQFDALQQLILAARPSGRVYLLHWHAGDWVATKAALVTRGTYRAIRVGKMLNPWALAVDVGVMAATETTQFKLMERRSEKLGRDLRNHLCEIPEAKSRRINLIGHSLGARVIHAALSHDDWSDYCIEDCVFLGGAADLDAEDWPDCLAQIRGRLFNGYSRHDLVLQLTPDLRSRVGRHPMQAVVIDGQDKVVNKNCGRFDHKDYWRRLGYILPKVWPGFARRPESEAFDAPGDGYPGLPEPQVDP